MEGGELTDLGRQRDKLGAVSEIQRVEGGELTDLGRQRHKLRVAFEMHLFRCRWPLKVPDCDQRHRCVLANVILDHHHGGGGCNRPRRVWIRRALPRQDGVAFASWTCALPDTTTSACAMVWSPAALGAAEGIDTGGRPQRL